MRFVCAWADDVIKTLVWSNLLITLALLLSASELSLAFYELHFSDELKPCIYQWPNDEEWWITSNTFWMWCGTILALFLNLLSCRHLTQNTSAGFQRVLVKLLAIIFHEEVSPSVQILDTQYLWLAQVWHSGGLYRNGVSRRQGRSAGVRSEALFVSLAFPARCFCLTHSAAARFLDMN